ncbi:hypothetical protein OG455_01775 [Kitasatospora sp. NBC_01287]|uniref:hypothetical protein n=1 Tax=Kitasatospora sp. NBC_01287 TaxID=2903573 RepID=UPI0022532A57|nr:hypothetical protein [Kitasatospora sp. NBC_01287]MCX4744253.1 hypothetical protein [Kitasatospora sp. NBC_01287]
MHRPLLRLTGAATALYGLAVTRRPELLARPSGLAGPGGEVPTALATCLRPLAFRDAASGLAMLLAPDDRSLRLATLVRIAADFGDAALLARALPGRRHRAMALAVSIGWGGLSVVGLLRPSPGRTGTGQPGQPAGEAAEAAGLVARVSGPRGPRGPVR